MLTLASRCLSFLPLPVLYRLAGLMHFLVYRVLRIRREVVESNLALAFPDRSETEIRELGRRVYRSYADVAVEMLRSLRMGRDELLERVRFEGDEALNAELAAGRPVLVTLAHQCNLEWMLLAACLRFDHPLEAVYRPLSDAGMEAVMTRAYTRFGGRLIDDRSVIRSIMERRSEPRIVTLASDQAPNVKDDVYWTTFLGRETGFFQSPEVIARFTGWPVYFAGMRRDARGRYTVSFSKLAEPPYRGRESVVMPAYVRAVEAQILAAPEDWLWMHRRWKRQRSMYDRAA
ncbi:MAG TPA: lysophospholipid acyltransferase family protein [Arenicellales bacterium]|nr:lysophospholipid acyltransferase family protein [Arenicellales bacterium]